MLYYTYAVDLQRTLQTLKKFDQVHNSHKQKNPQTEQQTTPGETTNPQVSKSLVLESKVCK